MIKPKVILLLCIGALGITFIAIRPHPASITFWLILIPGVACVITNYIIDRREANRDLARFKVWNAKLIELVDIDDFEDDGHLFEWFSEKEWNDIFQKLESMPKGSRSLKTAIETIIPEMKNEE